jgi:hypothetical protein
MPLCSWLRRDPWDPGDLLLRRPCGAVEAGPPHALVVAET